MSRYIWLSLTLVFCFRLTAQNVSMYKIKKADIEAIPAIDSIDVDYSSLVSHQLKKSCFFSKTILPGSLILTGAVLSGSLTEKSWQRDIRGKVGNDYHNGADNYMQFVPYGQVYLGDVMGLQAKNHWFDQTKNMAISTVLTTVIVHSLKIGVGKERPDGSAHNSFPSGHTTTAFTGAATLYYEFKDSHPFYAYSGFLFSTATGSLRVMNNRHWMGDVIAGAGIGILVVNAVYYFQPLKNWNPFRNSKNISFYPMINGDEVTFAATLRF